MPCVDVALDRSVPLSPCTVGAQCRRCHGPLVSSVGVAMGRWCPVSALPWTVGAQCRRCHGPLVPSVGVAMYMRCSRAKIAINIRLVLRRQL